MDRQAWEKQLHEEGFTHLFVWRDGPDATYPDHTHPVLTAHVVLEGEMRLTMNGQTETYKSGDRCDVPAHTRHSARMGPEGCQYLIGEK